MFPEKGFLHCRGSFFKNPVMGQGQKYQKDHYGLLKKQKFLLARQVLQRDPAQNGLHFFLNILPDGMNRTKSVPVTGAVVDEAAVQRDRPFHRFDDVQQGNFVRSFSQHKAAARPPVGFDQTGFTELLKDLGQKGLRNINAGGNFADQRDLSFRFSGQIDHAANRVIAFSCQMEHHQHLNKTFFVPLQDLKYAVNIFFTSDDFFTGRNRFAGRLFSDPSVQAIHGKDRTRMIIYLVHMLLEHTQGFISCDARLHIS